MLRPMTAGNWTFILLGAFVTIPFGILAAVSPMTSWRMSMFGRNWTFKGGRAEPSKDALAFMRLRGWLSIVIGIVMVMGGIAFRSPAHSTASAQGSGYKQGHAQLTLDGAVSHEFSGTADCANGMAQISILSPTDTTGPMTDNYDGGSIISLNATLDGSGPNTEATVDIWAIGSNGFALQAAYDYDGTGNLSSGIVLRSQGGQAFSGTAEPNKPDDTITISGSYQCPPDS